jgi:TolB-like protein
MFESWKEISAYLKRSYKTLRRLERELELPVHRLEDSPHARVFAYKEEIDRWMQEMQKTGKISRRKIGTKKFLTGALITLAVLYAAVIVGLFLWLFQPDETTVPLSLEKPSVAILGFENLSSDESLEYLRHGLQDLLTSDLSQSVYLRVLRRDEIDDVLNSLALFDAKRYSLRDKVDIAQRCRVDYLLCGSFIMAGNELEITAYLIDSETGETLFPLTAIAKGEGDIFRMVDGLTLDIKEKLSITQEQIVRDIDREARLITTSSPEAFRCFIIGKHNNSIGKYSKAIEVFERALDIDPEFAMVYREMAFSYEYMGQTETYFSLLE